MKVLIASGTNQFCSLPDLMRRRGHEVCEVATERAAQDRLLQMYSGEEYGLAVFEAGIPLDDIENLVEVTPQMLSDSLAPNLKERSVPAPMVRMAGEVAGSLQKLMRATEPDLSLCLSCHTRRKRPKSIWCVECASWYGQGT